MGKITKILFKLTGVLLVIVIGLLVFGSPNKKAKNEINYRTMSSRALNSYYEGVAKKAGVGIPDVDESVMYFEEYDTKKGLQVTKNVFKLAGNENIQHKYTMTWRQKTGELIQLVIDGNVVFHDEKGKLAADND